MPKFSVCVFCGSRHGNTEAFTDVAQALGTAIAQRDWRLVYGAGDVGLMGEVARAAMEAGGEVFGAIPQHLMQKEVGKRDITELLITDTMHERKNEMIKRSNAIVLLPGGPGSLDEFFEALTWKQIGIMRKPLIVLNVGGYWDKMIELITHMVDQGYAGEDTHTLYEVVPDLDSLMTRLQA